MLEKVENAMKTWDVFIRRRFVRTVKAVTKEDALTVAYYLFGECLAKIICVQLREDGSSL